MDSERYNNDSQEQAMGKRKDSQDSQTIEIRDSKTKSDWKSKDSRIPK